MAENKENTNLNIGLNENKLDDLDTESQNIETHKQYKNEEEEETHLPEQISFKSPAGMELSLTSQKRDVFELANLFWELFQLIDKPKTNGATYTG